MFDRITLTLFAMFAAILAVTATVLAGPIWDCQDPQEPGGTPATAEIVTGSGPLATIRCTLTGRIALIDDPDGDFQDMFLIRIADPANLEIRTVDPLTGDEFNTQIWLFDINGRGVLANLNDAGNPPFSLMGNAATDGSGVVVTDPGLYYIAVSGGQKGEFGRVPVDADGAPIFEINPFQPELVYGPASSNPVAGWKGEGGLGDYELEFIGVEFVSTAAIPTITEWGLVVLGLLLLTAGTLVIRQYQRQPSPAGA
jgi:hypothetical protein